MTKIEEAMKLIGPGCFCEVNLGNILLLTGALKEAIEQHEAFRQEVSDVVEAVFAGYHDAPIPWVVMRCKLDRFIIAKPDPLVEAWDETWAEPSDKPARLETFRAALAKRGGRIVFDD